MVRGKPIPPYTSPMVEVFREANGQIIDGRILHVQAVSSPGYDPSVAKIVGSCEGLLNKCSVELRALGAASALKSWQDKVKVDENGQRNVMFYNKEEEETTD